MAPLPRKAARLVCALIAISAVSAPALAAGPYRGGPRHGPSYKAPCIQKAGTLRINQHYCTIAERGGIKRQIVRAFKRAGYDAWVEYGEVRVRTSRYNKPSVSWHAGSFDASVRYARGCIIIKPYERCAVIKPKPYPRRVWKAPRWHRYPPACPRW